MGNISPTLKEKLERNPTGILGVIVRVQGDAATHTLQVQSFGLSVKHAYTLIPGFALQGTGSAILTLAKESWVVSIEEDKPVHTMS